MRLHNPHAGVISALTSGTLPAFAQRSKTPFAPPLLTQHMPLVDARVPLDGHSKNAATPAIPHIKLMSFFTCSTPRPSLCKERSSGTETGAASALKAPSIGGFRASALRENA